MWWLEQAVRLKEERLAISELEEHSTWLQNIEWNAASGPTFEVDFDIVHGEETFNMRLRYPVHFPDTPPPVYPQEKQKLSPHQYGAGGELCLEYRADNWEQHITGAMMIESANRLLSGERPDEEGNEGEVPSAHQENIGQKLRCETLRFLITPDLKEILKQLEIEKVYSATFTEHRLEKTDVASINSITCAEKGNLWHNTTVLRGDKTFNALLVVTPKLPSVAKLFPTESLVDALGYAGFTDEADRIVNDSDVKGILLTDGDSTCFGYIIRSEEKRKIIWYENIETPELEVRLPPSYTELKDKSVGIIGCGSMGSKIASSLARSGVEKFVLIDDDILMPGNIVRNDLDTRNTGHHKAIALKDRLKAISPKCKIISRQIAIGGQESAGAAASALEQLTDCDLLIDATANPEGFNRCSAIAQLKNKSLIWAEVFAGGIGGMIVRARPDKDPPPSVARRQIYNWCEEQGVPWTAEASGYDAQDEGLPPLVADDADVSVIAAHATRFATDILAQPDESIFPCSAYMVGLKEGWMFSQPFETHPITLTPESWKSPKPIDQEAMKEAMDFMMSLIPKTEDKDEDSASA